MARRPPVYVALIGDVVGSRSLAAKQRQLMQRHLRAWLGLLNERLGQESLAAPLTMTAGDEIQGLFRKPSALVTVIQDLTDRMFQLDGQPHALYGAGRGALSTGEIPAPPGWAESPALLDGPAFHSARAALEQAQDEGGWVRFVGFGDRRKDYMEDRVLEALFGLMGTIRESWTAKQGRYSYLMRTGRSQKDLAEEFSISPSVVSETLKASRHSLLLQGEKAARLLLETLDPGRR